jgi:hypothetical protein
MIEVVVFTHIMLRTLEEMQEFMNIVLMIVLNGINQ